MSTFLNFGSSFTHDSFSSFLSVIFAVFLNLLMLYFLFVFPAVSHINSVIWIFYYWSFKRKYLLVFNRHVFRNIHQISISLHEISKN